jgi:hypothetical protein
LRAAAEAFPEAAVFGKQGTADELAVLLLLLLQAPTAKAAATTSDTPATALLRLSITVS